MSYKATSITESSAQVTTAVASPKVSETYGLVRTEDVVHSLQSKGWQWSSGSTRICRKPELQDFAYHVARLRHPDIRLGDDGALAEVILINSHNGTSSFELSAGVFRVACANGLIVQSVSCGALRRRHNHLQVQDILTDVDEVVSKIPQVAGTVRAWRNVQLDEGKKDEFAGRAGLLRWNAKTGSALYNAYEVLRPRRYEDHGNDLWTVFNRAQEGVVRGGPRVRNLETGNLRAAPPVRGVRQQVDLNRSLWALAEEYATAA